MFYEKLLGLLGGALLSPESKAAKWYLNNKKQVRKLRNCVYVCVCERERERERETSSTSQARLTTVADTVFIVMVELLRSRTY